LNLNLDFARLSSDFALPGRNLELPNKSGLPPMMGALKILSAIEWRRPTLPRKSVAGLNSLLVPRLSAVLVAWIADLVRVKWPGLRIWFV